jgi:hypothetical protein
MLVMFLNQQKKTYFDSYILSYNRNLNKYLSLTIGPGFNVEKFNIPYITVGTDEFFKTTTPKLLIGFRYNDLSRQFYLRPKIEIDRFHRLENKTQLALSP